jgi:hypothetical protein
LRESVQEEDEPAVRRPLGQCAELEPACCHDDLAHRSRTYSIRDTGRRAPVPFAIGRQDGRCVWVRADLGPSATARESTHRAGPRSRVRRWTTACRTRRHLGALGHIPRSAAGTSGDGERRAPDGREVSQGDRAMPAPRKYHQETRDRAVRMVTTVRGPNAARHPDLIHRAWSVPTRPDKWWFGALDLRVDTGCLRVHQLRHRRLLEADPRVTGPVVERRPRCDERVGAPKLGSSPTSHTRSSPPRPAALDVCTRAPHSSRCNTDR